MPMHMESNEIRHGHPGKRDQEIADCLEDLFDAAEEQVLLACDIADLLYELRVALVRS